MLFSLFLLFGLIVFSALFSGSESALFSLSPSDLQIIKAKYPRYYKRILFFKNNNEGLLITILIGNLIVNIGASSLAAQLALNFFSSNALEMSALIMTFVIIIFGEILPKTYAVKSNFQFLRITNKILYFLYRLFFPIIWILKKLTKLIVGEEKNTKQSSYSMGDLKKAVDMGFHSGEINIWEKAIISHLVELEKTKVFELMVPRVKMVGLDLENQPITDVIHLYEEYRVKKIPIFQDSLENVLGILYLKDIIGISQEELKNEYKKYLRAPLYVPETKKVSDLLKEFKDKQRYFAIVIDEYGSVSGMITLNIILESFVEDMIPERFAASIEKLNDYNYVVPADLSLDKFNLFFKARLEDDDYESIGGYIIRNFQRIPKNGEILRSERFVFTILKASPNRILKIKVKIR